MSNFGVASSLLKGISIVGWMCIIGAGGLFLSDELGFTIAIPAALLGFVIIATAQLALATIATAENTHETNQLLKKIIANGLQAPSNTNETAKPIFSGGFTKNATGDRSNAQTSYVKTYKGYRIDKIEGTRTFLVEGQEFEGLLAAENHISNLAGGM